MRYLPGQWAMFPPSHRSPPQPVHPSIPSRGELTGWRQRGRRVCGAQAGSGEQVRPWRGSLAAGVKGLRRAGPRGCGTCRRWLGWWARTESGAGGSTVWPSIHTREGERQRSIHDPSSIGPSIHSGTAQQPRHSSCQLPARGSQLLPLTVPASIQRSKRPSSEAANRQAGGGKAMDGESRTNGGRRGLGMPWDWHWHWHCIGGVGCARSVSCASPGCAAGKCRYRGCLCCLCVCVCRGGPKSQTELAPR
jgi:hypothetical protein